MFDAVVLAGTGKPDALAMQERVFNKAFIKINNRYLISYILEALKEAPSLGQVTVVGPLKELGELAELGYTFKAVEEQDSMLGSLAAGLATQKEGRLLFVATGDIPLLTADVIERFLKLCAPFDHDFYYPVLTKKLCLEKYPQTERTYVRLKEGKVTGGNVALCNPRWFLENRSRLEMFIAYRKQPLKLLGLFPKTFIIKYIFNRLSVTDAEDFLSSLFAVKARAIFAEDAQIGIDVDKPADLALVKSMMLQG